MSGRWLFSAALLAIAPAVAVSFWLQFGRRIPKWAVPGSIGLMAAGVLATCGAVVLQHS